jgi:hypothetical protein
MGGRVQEDKETAQGNRPYGRENNQTTCKSKAGRKQKLKAPEPVAADLLKITLDHFFPDFKERLGNLPEPRLPERIVYSKEHLFFLGLSMFLFHCGSRNQMENERRTPAFHRNLLALSGTDEECVASTEAMNYLMENMDPSGGMELISGEMVDSLIRARALDRYRNSSGEFMIAMDGVHLFTRKGVQPNSVCKTVDGERCSYYYALEAKLVTGDGMGLSLATVFIETKRQYNKEDCELNAFYRLEKILKKRFPRLMMCILLDSLYANQNVLRICERNSWGYFITLKDGSIPSLYQAAARQIERSPRQSTDHSPEKGVYRHISWALNMKHEGNQFHVLFCEETSLAKDGIERKKFVWLTDVRPNENNVVQLVKEARCRWVVEEMFNIQKNGGYELEHNFGTVGFAMKNYYYLLQVAHMLNQLMVRSDLFPKLQGKFILLKFGQLPGQVKLFLAAMAETTLENFRTIRNFVRRLAESFRSQHFSELATNPESLGKIQIRFSSA